MPTRCWWTSPSADDADYHLAANLVYSADSSVIDTVICDGRILMENRRIDGEEEILADARRTCVRLRNL